MRKQKLILPFVAPPPAPTPPHPGFAVILCCEARLHRALQRDGGGEGRMGNGSWEVFAFC